jgi:hypothetical protein
MLTHASLEINRLFELSALSLVISIRNVGHDPYVCQVRIHGIKINYATPDITPIPVFPWEYSDYVMT